MKLAIKILFLSVVVLVLVYWFAGNKIFEFAILKLVAVRTESIAPNHAVAWEKGPATADVPISERPPNIILILADDLGYNDLTVNGGGVAGGAVPTPHIDSLAREGVVFTDGYANNATCAPSRAAMMTGRYATRFGFEFTPTPIQFPKVVHRIEPDRTLYYPELVKECPPYEDQGMPPEEITIAELLKVQGYRTLMLGKWHLGETIGMQPGDQGFDEWLGFYDGATLFLPKDDPDVVNARLNWDSIDKFLWANLVYHIIEDGGERFEPQGYLTDYLTDEAIKAIEANRNRPFFMFLSHAAVHTPLQASKADYNALPQIEEHALRVYGGMIRALDRGVGRVLQALKDNGLEENTLVIFTTDNGGAGYIGLPDINKPYRGWKATFFEGGLHAPFFMKWPKGLPRGATYDQPVAHFDIFATAAGAAGIPLPDDRDMDGIDLVPYISGEKQGSPHEALFWESGHYRSVLAGGWKLQVAERPRKEWLFNLNQDPTEQVNLVEQHPQKVLELKRLIEEHRKELAQPIWPSLIEGRFTIDHPTNVPIGEDDEYIFWPN